MPSKTDKVQAIAMVTKSESKRIREEAEKEYLSVSAFVRKVVMEYIDRKKS